jgi:hypothetical protein
MTKSDLVQHVAYMMASKALDGISLIPSPSLSETWLPQYLSKATASISARE